MAHPEIPGEPCCQIIQRSGVGDLILELEALQCFSRGELFRHALQRTLPAVVAGSIRLIVSLLNVFEQAI